MQELDPSRLCRDDECDRIGIHLAHDVTRKPERKYKSVSPRAVWDRASPKALDHSIALATSKTYPRHFSAILQIVENDYGSCNYRTVARRLKRLVQRGHLLRIDLGQQLYAYLRPGSPMEREIDLMREQCCDAIEAAIG